MTEEKTTNNDVEFRVEQPVEEQVAHLSVQTETPVQGKQIPWSTDNLLGDKTLEDVIKQEAIEEQETSSQFSISKTLGGVIIAQAVQKQMWLLILISSFLIIYISNRYVCQKKLVEIDKLETKLVEARYKSIVCTSILTEKSRESNIIALLNAYGDSTLQIPQDPPYLIKVPDSE